MEVHRFHKKVQDSNTDYISKRFGIDASKIQIQLYFPGQGLAGFTEGKFDFYKDDEQTISHMNSVISNGKVDVPLGVLGVEYVGQIDLPKDVVDSFVFRQKVKRLSDEAFDSSTKSLTKLLA